MINTRIQQLEAERDVIIKTLDQTRTALINLRRLLADQEIIIRDQQRLIDEYELDHPFHDNKTMALGL